MSMFKRFVMLAVLMLLVAIVHCTDPVSEPPPCGTDTECGCVDDCLDSPSEFVKE